MTDISREIEGQISVPFKTSRTSPDDSTKKIIADRETQKGKDTEENIKDIQSLSPLIEDKREIADEKTQKSQAVKDNVKIIQQAQPLKSGNVDVVI